MGSVLLVIDPALPASAASDLDPCRVLLKELGVAFVEHTYGGVLPTDALAAIVLAAFVAPAVGANPGNKSGAAWEVAAGILCPVFVVPASGSGVDGLARASGTGLGAGTLAVGKAGVVNAALLAAAVVGETDEGVRARLKAWREARTAQVLERPDPSVPERSNG